MKLRSWFRYPTEELDSDYDNGTMAENVAQLEQAIVGRHIVSAQKEIVTSSWGSEDEAMVITLDDGHRVILHDSSDCCAYTHLESFLLNPEMVRHAILGVGTTDDYTTWHIYADYGDIMTLELGWSSGNPFYYGYGFDIRVEAIP